MLRPTSRRGRFSAALFVASFVATLLLPIGTLARGVDTPANSLVADAPPAERTPKLEGRGVHDVEAGRGQKPKEPLQDLAFDPGADAQAAPSGPLAVTAAPPATLATSSGAPAVTSFAPWGGLTQDGSAAICPAGASCAEREPPDASVAVGPNDVVQIVNTDLRFTNREGVVTKDSLDAYEFFQVATFTFDDQPVTIDGISDLRWIYDAKHDRWFGTVTAWHCDDDPVGEDDDGYGFVLAALSTTDNPRGSYYFFSVQYDFLPVGPMVGTSADKLVISASEYALSPSACAGTLVKDTPSLLTLSWADLMTFPAAPLNTYSLIGPSPSTYEAPRPAIAPKGTSNTIFGVVANNTSSSTSNVVSFRITGSLTAATDTIALSLVDVTAAEVVAPFQSPPAPAQPGGTLASAVTRYPTHAIWQDNVLSFASTYPCDPAGGASGENRACARVTQLATTALTPPRIQDMLIGTTAKDSWTPGIAQSQNGTLHVVYTQSSSSEGMSSYATYQLASDPLNTFHTPLELADGGATHYNGSRWGNFTMPAQDPRDTNAVWQGNQYTKSDGKWATRISELQTPGATFVAIPPVRLLDTRVDAGLIGMFSAHTSRALLVAGRGGIPTNAVAVTGNLTVTGQTGPGYLSVTPTPNTNPSTSTLNFPLGDTRANNFTSPLAKDRTLSVYFNAASGRKAHVILDVTGYFLDGATGATYIPLGEPVRSLDTRNGTGGLTGKFVHGVVRNWQVDGPTGVVPTEAIAVTGNLTITGQTTRGVASLGPTVASDPTTSTVNAPVGDNRANGITVGLAANGTLSAVFRGTSSTASAHLIFDVTGYYVPGLSGARFVPISPGRRMDTRIGLGLPGAFAGGVARTLDIEPFQGVPANATAITGNLTVVNQTKAGFLAMTAVADNTPETSTLNFPTGDTRANGVTGPLSPAGTVGLVYFTGSATGTTHVILDITGYFR